MSPIMPGMAHANPTYEREFGIAAAIFTAVKIATTVNKNNERQFFMKIER